MRICLSSDVMSTPITGLYIVYIRGHVHMCCRTLCYYVLRVHMYLCYRTIYCISEGLYAIMSPEVTSVTVLYLIYIYICANGYLMVCYIILGVLRYHMLPCGALMDIIMDTLNLLVFSAPKMCLHCFSALVQWTQDLITDYTRKSGLGYTRKSRLKSDTI